MWLISNFWIKMNWFIYLCYQWLQLQQVGFFSVSLKKKMGVYPNAAPSQPQHATLGLQLGFSQTNSHLGLGHSGFVHFQSHLGSSHTASHSGLGAFILKSNLTMSDTVGLFANGHTFGAVFSLACFVWAFNLN